MGFEKTRYIHRLTVIIMMVVALTAGSSLCDEINDLLTVEDRVRTGLDQKTANVKLKEGKNAYGSQTNKSEVQLLNELQKKQLELVRAKEEIERLKGLVTKMLEASRSERQKLCYNLGCVYRAAKEYKKAEVEYIKALDLNPNDPAVHFNLAVLYDDDLKDAKKARKHYEKFLELAPDDKDAQLVREWLMVMK